LQQYLLRSDLDALVCWAPCILGANFAGQVFQMPRRIARRVRRMGWHQCTWGWQKGGVGFAGRISWEGSPASQGRLQRHDLRRTQTASRTQGQFHRVLIIIPTAIWPRESRFCLLPPFSSAGTNSWGGLDRKVNSLPDIVNFTDRGSSRSGWDGAEPALVCGCGGGLQS